MAPGRGQQRPDRLGRARQSTALASVERFQNPPREALRVSAPIQTLAQEVAPDAIPFQHSSFSNPVQRTGVSLLWTKLMMLLIPMLVPVKTRTRLRDYRTTDHGLRDDGTTRLHDYKTTDHRRLASGLCLLISAYNFLPCLLRSAIARRSAVAIPSKRAKAR
jgi:hypothetical protein